MNAALTIISHWIGLWILGCIALTGLYMLAAKGLKS